MPALAARGVFRLECGSTPIERERDADRLKRALGTLGRNYGISYERPGTSRVAVW